MSNRSEPVRSEVDAEAKLAAIREAAEYSFPTADIDQMLAEIKGSEPEQR